MRTRFVATLLVPAALSALLGTPLVGQESKQDEAAILFDDAPLEEPLAYPDWFKDSFLYLEDDLRDALEKGKDGIIVYFGQR
ncbi:MAG: thioredoxin, partial [Chromatiales bacterium]